MPFGSTMDGMDMPAMNDADSATHEVALAQLSESRHAVISDVGPCERQSCDQEQTVASKVSHVNAAQFDTIWAAPRVLHIDSHRAMFHGARDGLISISPPIQVSLSLSLRI
jgi:hypothetical protein